VNACRISRFRGHKVKNLFPGSEKRLISVGYVR
jgi:hypothetical protein